MNISKILGLFKSSEKVMDTGCNVVETATKGIYNGLDACFYTAEEKAQDAQATARGQQEAFETILEFQKSYVNENSQQSMARRELARLTFGVYYALIFILITLWRIDPDWCKAAIDIVKVVSSSYLLLMVAGTYFVPHQFSKLSVFKGKGAK